MLCGVPKQSVILDILIDHEKSRAREEILWMQVCGSMKNLELEKKFPSSSGCKSVVAP